MVQFCDHILFNSIIRCSRRSRRPRHPDNAVRDGAGIWIRRPFSAEAWIEISVGAGCWEMSLELHNDSVRGKLCDLCIRIQSRNLLKLACGHRISPMVDIALNGPVFITRDLDDHSSRAPTMIDRHLRQTCNVVHGDVLESRLLKKSKLGDMISDTKGIVSRHNIGW